LSTSASYRRSQPTTCSVIYKVFCLQWVYDIALDWMIHVNRIGYCGQHTDTIQKINIRLYSRQMAAPVQANAMMNERMLYFHNQLQHFIQCSVGHVSR